MTNRHWGFALCLAATTIAGSMAGAQSDTPGMSATVGFGARVQPGYFGSDSYVTRPAGAVVLHSLNIGQLSFGDPIPGERELGFNVTGAFRRVLARQAEDHPELTGLRDVGFAIEMGLGLDYDAENWRAFADLRRGVIGHQTWLGELGADAILSPTSDLHLSVGPRLLFGSDAYAETYFGVSASEAMASGSIPAFDASGGLLSAGVEAQVTYDLTPQWSAVGRLRVTHLLGDAESSPITALGTPLQADLRVTLQRHFTLAF